MLYKVDAMGDEVFIRAKNRQEAKEILRYNMGDVPESVLTWTDLEDDGRSDSEVLPRPPEK